MFSATRKAILDSCVWRKRGGDVDFVEAWQYEDTEEANDTNFSYGSLKDGEIADWITESEPSQSREDKRKHVGRIRMIVCERALYDPIDFPMTKHLFTRLEKEFCLHPSTLSTFRSHSGTFSRHLTFCENDRSKLKRVAIILKAPQKREVANYGLSLSHDVESHTTTALLYGAEVLNRPLNQSGGNMYKHKPPMYSWPYTPPVPIPGLLELIRSVPYAWSHPLLLPSLLVSHHMSLSRAYINHGAADETVAIEFELGVTRVGQKDSIAAISAAKGPEVKIRAAELTTRINTHTTRILFMSRSPEWNLKCSRFLLDLLTHLEPRLCDLSATSMHNELKELVESNMGFGEAAVADTKSTTARMALQLNVLYNFIAQADNALNAQLAASAGRDSTSMKILAFISALFLPGSFVAGVFSMTMFDWQYSGDGGAGAGVVSNRFWIYWVIAVPLTMITLLGWGFWWRLEMKRYQTVFQHATGEPAAEKEKDARGLLAQTRENIMQQRDDSEVDMPVYLRILGTIIGAGRRTSMSTN